MKGFCFCSLLFFGSCNLQVSEKNEGLTDRDSTAYTPPAPAPQKSGRDTNGTAQTGTAVIYAGEVDTKSVLPGDVVAFAKTQLGVPYLYGAADPAQGFDCSGFITYVFNQFGIAVPRSSVDFTHVGKEVPAAAALPGDLVLFTGTDSAEKSVGHMGIVVAGAPDTLRFIHATSGKAYGVTITPLNDYYRSRYVKTIRVFGK